MIKNKRARKTLALPGTWDHYRAINKRLNNKVVISLDADGWVFAFSTTNRSDNEVFPNEAFYKGN